VAKIAVIGSLAESLVNFRGTMLEEMARRGHEVIACAPAAKGGDIVERLRAIGARFVDVAIDNRGLDPVADLRTIGSLRRMLLSERPDRILTYTIKPVIYGSLAGRLTRMPFRTAMITGLGHAFAPGSGLRRLIVRGVPALYRVALRGCRVVFFQNDDDLQTFRRLNILSSGTAAIRIPGSGVDLDRFAVAPLPKRPTFLLLTRLIADKGVREFVTAAGAVAARFPAARFRIGGWLDSGPRSIRQAEIDAWQAGPIEYLGHVENVVPAIADSSIYVLPSYYREGVPRSILEAMSMGRAVITTDAPGCRDTVEPGVNGLLVPVRDAAALASAMLELASDPGRVTSMGAAGRRRAQDHFDVHRVNAIVLDHLELEPLVS